jgi:hypothetical protein
LECILNQVDPQFETTQGLQYRLSILLCEEGFSFLITDNSSHKLMCLASYKSSHAGIHNNESAGWPENKNSYFDELRNHELTQITYGQVDIAIASHKITVAPHDFLEPENNRNIISVAHTVQDTEEILTEPIFGLGPVVAIAIPSYIKESCERIFPGSILHASAAVFVKAVLQSHSQSIARQIFLNLYNGFFEIVVIQGSRLLYLNTFRYTAPSDVLYYVIFVLEQLGFVPSEENVTVTGSISGNETIMTQLKMYCASLSFAERPENIGYSESFAGIEMHKYFTLLNLSLCE